jgi:hypothetical protein
MHGYARVIGSRLHSDHLPLALDLDRAIRVRMLEQEGKLDN